ncbi:Hypothetical_protein [Hexamita inflata]|uniref:Hypothetical_protein n=1 Tax=Hexamita inflata TaxID=28002 RepID=A0AA86U2V8_9EUKA|nr:Hypothetical protein HINF_LOCUS27720 [Hexamita inflata]
MLDGNIIPSDSAYHQYAIGQVLYLLNLGQYSELYQNSIINCLNLKFVNLLLICIGLIEFYQAKISKLCQNPKYQFFDRIQIQQTTKDNQLNNQAALSICESSYKIFIKVSNVDIEAKIDGVHRKVMQRIRSKFYDVVYI